MWMTRPPAALDTGSHRHDVHHHENRDFTAPGRDHLRNIRHQRKPSESVKNTRPAVAAFGRFRAAMWWAKRGRKREYQFGVIDARD